MDPDLINQIRRFLIKLLFFLIPTQLGYHFWPEWSFVLGRRIDYLSPTVYFTDMIIFLIFLTDITYLRNFFRRKKITKELLLLATFLIINLVFSIRPAVTIYTLLKLAELYILYVILTKEKILPLNYLAGGVFLNSLLGLWQITLGKSVGGIFWLLGERTFSSATPAIALQSNPFTFGSNGNELLRAYGTTPHPNILAAAIVFVFILLVQNRAYLERFTGKKTFLIKAMALGILVCGLIATGSRSGVFALAIGITAICIRKRILSKNEGVVITKLKQRKIVLVFGGLICLSALLFFSSPVRSRQTISERLGQTQIAVQLFAAHPLTGIGLGTYPAGVPRVTKERANNILQPVHNVPLLFLAESGIWGLIIIYFLFKWSTRKIKFLTPLALILFIMLLTDHYLYTLQTGRLLTVIFIALITTNKE